MVIKALDPDWIRIRIGLQPQTLDPDPEKNEYGSETLDNCVFFYYDREPDRRGG